ncbi:MAG: polysaccharide biosynthesis tyrosine autokinase [Scytonema sp. PMC 1069.18]|nr:polysaccharide biosynthesis tyrosine autokinase [Scytonema sp. PMC 1069.18]MEC4885431.1 polysaccharide biosynthesis tyrosine autokinase [Scytonema sp. PMC 1070.18]
MADIGLERGNIVITSQKNTVEVRKITKILLNRRRQILSVACAIMSIASVLAFFTKPTYQSSMQILVSSNLYNGIQFGQEGVDSKLTGSNSEAFDYTPQLKLMLSYKLIQKVVDSLRSEYPNLKVEDIKGQKDKAPRLALTKVESNTNNNQRTQVFEVSFHGDEPMKTQKVLQAIYKVYQDYKVDQQKQRLSRGLSFINERLPQVKSEIAQAEKNLESFRKKHNLLDPDLQSKILLESLADVQNNIRTIRAQLQDTQARYNNLKKELSALSQNSLTSSRLSQSPQYQTLLSEIQKTELALAQVRLHYTDNYPTVQKLLQQRHNQMALLQKEIERSLEDKTEGEESDTVLKTKQLLIPQLYNQETILQIPDQITEVDQNLTEDLIQVQTTLLGLHANEKSLAASEKQIRSDLNKYPSLIAEYNRLLPEVQTHRKTLEHLLQMQQSIGLMVAQGGFDLQVLEEPQRGAYIGSSKFLFILIGALLGPILGVASAFILEAVNDAISSPQEMQKLTNLFILGTLPRLPQWSPNKKLFVPSVVRKILPNSLLKAIPEQQVLLDLYAMSPSHEVLDMVYQNIQLKSSVPCKSLMLTSAVSKEGKSTIALGLAISAARRHRRVLLIDANLRQPSLHQMLGLPNDWGLSLLLLEETNSAAKTYVQPIHPCIDVLTAGQTPEDTVKLLSSRRMKELLEFFEQTYDIVLIDTSSILGTVDARMIATLCNGIVMVGRLGHVTPLQLTEATNILSNLNLIGVVTVSN